MLSLPLKHTHTNTLEGVYLHDQQHITGDVHTRRSSTAAAVVKFIPAEMCVWVSNEARENRYQSRQIHFLISFYSCSPSLPEQTILSDIPSSWLMSALLFEDCNQKRNRRIFIRRIRPTQEGDGHSKHRKWRRGRDKRELDRGRETTITVSEESQVCTVTPKPADMTSNSFFFHVPSDLWPPCAKTRVSLNSFKQAVSRWRH